MKIVYTKHAEKKLRELKSVGVIVVKKDIVKTIRTPEHLDKESDYPKIIASRGFNEKHILRVVFKVEGGKITVITFYPARKGRYYAEN